MFTISLSFYSWKTVLLRLVYNIIVISWAYDDKMKIFVLHRLNDISFFLSCPRGA